MRIAAAVLALVLAAEEARADEALVTRDAVPLVRVEVPSGEVVVLDALTKRERCTTPCTFLAAPEEALIARTRGDERTVSLREVEGVRIGVKWESAPSAPLVIVGALLATGGALLIGWAVYELETQPPPNDGGRALAAWGAAGGIALAGVGTLLGVVGVLHAEPRVQIERRELPTAL